MDTLTRVLFWILKPMFCSFAEGAEAGGTGAAVSEGEGEPEPAGEGEPAPEPSPAPEPDFKWKSQLPADYANSPTIKKYADTKKGFADAIKSHLELQKMLGHEKVPVPKGPDDQAALAIFKRAFQIPDKPEGYALPDVEVPANMEGLSFDKQKFAEIIHPHNLTPAQAKGLWKAYEDYTKGQVAEQARQFQETVTQVRSELQREWGDAYDSKIELGQMVINKFAGSQEANDYLTAALAKNPHGVRFLAALGDQFAENRIGEFKYQRHSLTPDEIQNELGAIRRDMSHPYNNEKAPQRERDAAIDYVNRLLEALSRAKTSV